MAIIRCKMCGGNLILEEGKSVAECEYCGSVQTVPNADNEKKLTLFGRANRLRASCDFDKAAGIYESIVAEFPGEAEAYWGLVLCKYGIEYVEDPATGKRIPTCHRSSFESVMEDTNLEQAVENADVVAQKVYRQEAKAIEEIRKGILEVSSQEAPYDIFICYKETDETGGRTLDSVIAQDMYDALTDKGYRVFFSRITLEDKLGQAYEPYIFAALNSAKVMLAVGTCFEYYNAVWVKNEWSRYIKICAADKSKHLIPCYKNLDAYDMPKEFQHLQGQDMGKMGAIQDLLRGIEKYIPLKQQAQPSVMIQPSVSANAAVVEPLMRRAQLFLEEKDFRNASTYFDKVLDVDPENAFAYTGKVCAAYKLAKIEDLAAATPAAFADKNFKSALRFADENLKNTLQSYELSAKLLHNFNQACQDQRSAKTIQDFRNVADLFATMGEYKDAKNRAEKCYSQAAEMEQNAYQEACRKQDAMKTSVQANDAVRSFDALGNYKDSKDRAEQCRTAATKLEAEEKRQQQEAQEKAAAEKAAQAAAKKKKARTTGTIIGIVIAAIIAVVIIVVTVIIPKQEYNEAVAYAESLLAQGNFDDAIERFAELGNTDKITEAMWSQVDKLVAEEEYDDALDILTILHEEYAQATALERKADIYYAKGISSLDAGKYGIAVQCFNEIPGHKDADQLLQEATALSIQASYERGMELLGESDFENAAEAFLAAGDFEDAANMAIYAQAREIAYDDLLAAEELLLSLSREMLDVDAMLTAIDNYRGWGGTFNCIDFSSNDNIPLQLYYYVSVAVRYVQDRTMEEPIFKITVTTYSDSGKKIVSYGSDSLTPDGNKIRFTHGTEGDDWKDIVVTKDTVWLDDHETQKYGGGVETDSYIFERAE